MSQSSNPPRSGSQDVQDVLELVRHRVARSRAIASSPLVPVVVRNRGTHHDAITVNALPLFAIPSIDIALSHSTLVLPLCALCGALNVCTYLSNFHYTPQRGAFGASPTTVAIMPRDLCEECFMKVYHAVIRPAIAQDDLSIRMGLDLANLAQLSSAADADAAAALKRLVPIAMGSRWTCPRCTYAGNINGDPVDNGCCAACGGPSPHLTSCVHCGVVLTPAHMGKPCVASLAGCTTTTTTGAKQHEVALTQLRRHVPWECPTCTFVNTVDSEVCFTCHQSRLWECPRCGVRNSSRRGPMGERDCFCCGHQSIDLAASTAMRMGLDPEAIIRSKQEDEATRGALRRLDDRLSQAGLVRRSQLGDGNCQFRSLAQQILRNPELHMFIRFMATEHMKRHYARDYAPLFDGEEDFMRYIATMRLPKTWGDEMTLRAVADAFKCSILVVTSDVQRWLLRFDPSPPEAGAAAANPPPTALLNNLVPTVVLAYQYPVHYDDVAVDAARVLDARCLVLPRSTDLAEIVAKTLGAFEADEAQWEDAADDFNRRDEWLDVRSHQQRPPPPVDAAHRHHYDHPPSHHQPPPPPPPIQQQQLKGNSNPSSASGTPRLKLSIR